MTEEKRKEFFTKFTKVVGDTTKHYEFKDVDPLEVFGWIESYAEKKMEERDREVAKLRSKLNNSVRGDMEGQKEFESLISKYQTQPMLGETPGTRPEGFISLKDVLNKIEAYTQAEIAKKMEELIDDCSNKVIAYKKKDKVIIDYYDFLGLISDIKDKYKPN